MCGQPEDDQCAGYNTLPSLVSPRLPISVLSCQWDHSYNSVRAPVWKFSILSPCWLYTNILQSITTLSNTLKQQTLTYDIFLLLDLQVLALYFLIFLSDNEAKFLRRCPLSPLCPLFPLCGGHGPPCQVSSLLLVTVKEPLTGRWWAVLPYPCFEMWEPHDGLTLQVAHVVGVKQWTAQTSRVLEKLVTSGDPGTVNHQVKIDKADKEWSTYKSFLVVLDISAWVTLWLLLWRLPWGGKC